MLQYARSGDIVNPRSLLSSHSSSMSSLVSISSCSSSSSRSSISSISLHVSAELSLLLLSFESILLNFLPSLVLWDERKTSSWTIQRLLYWLEDLPITIPSLHFPVLRCEVENCPDCDPWEVWSRRSMMMTTCSGLDTWHVTWGHWDTCRSRSDTGRRSSWVSCPLSRSWAPPPGTRGLAFSSSTLRPRNPPSLCPRSAVGDTPSSGSDRSLSGAALAAGWSSCF